MAIISKNSLKVVSDDGWEFSTQDKNHMLYTENKFSFIIESEYEYCSPDKEILTVIYFDTIKSHNHDKQLNDLDKARIKKRVKLALDEMGGKYEIC